MKKVLFLIALCLCSCASSAKKEVEVQWKCKKINSETLTNISALSECYGYIRFFYPNPNLKNVNWTKFLMYSVDKIWNVKNDNELKHILLELFEPLCPQITFSTDKVISNTILQPPFYAIEHKAIGTMAEMFFGKSYSPIVQITKQNIDYNDVYCYKLKDNLYVNFPVAVKNLPIKTDKLKKLEKKLKKINEGKVGVLSALFNQKNVYKGNIIYKRLSYRIADIIIRKNYIQHFYPYFAEDNLTESWDNEFSKTIENIVLTDNMYNYFMEIKKLLANINDSHINIWNTFLIGTTGAYLQYFYPNITYSFANGTCYIAGIGQEYENDLKRGDIIKSVNNTSIETLIEQKLQEISFSTRANGLYRMSNLFQSQKRDSVITIAVETADKTEKL